MRALYSRVAGKHFLYLGRWPSKRQPDIDPSVIGISCPPHEPVEGPQDGCPAGWARSPFVNSVARYARRRTEGGGRVPNPFFDRAPWQVQEAVLYYEDEQERWHEYKARVDADRWAKKKKG